MALSGVGNSPDSPQPDELHRLLIAMTTMLKMSFSSCMRQASKVEDHAKAKREGAVGVDNGREGSLNAHGLDDLVTMMEQVKADLLLLNTHRLILKARWLPSVQARTPAPSK